MNKYDAKVRLFCGTAKFHYQQKQVSIFGMLTQVVERDE
jgi:hypothetical protein